MRQFHCILLLLLFLLPSPALSQSYDGCGKQFPSTDEAQLNCLNGIKELLASIDSIERALILQISSINQDTSDLSALTSGGHFPVDDREAQSKIDRLRVLLEGQSDILTRFAEQVKLSSDTNHENIRDIESLIIDQRDQMIRLLAEVGAFNSSLSDEIDRLVAVVSNQTDAISSISSKFEVLLQPVTFISTIIPLDQVSGCTESSIEDVKNKCLSAKLEQISNDFCSTQPNSTANFRIITLINRAVISCSIHR
ncbi:hypothetical protein RDV64_23315 (plasmid) [Acuticoccus sp. MNP-M23]|uniref:hypothetical protein n=1 Tax=Acuticoccus sp. MNP-M23 TaxID=3072793 RepID=UPI00281668A4|nr:hypothetical protein [Acuticoccus sp. MNP-M23]WMS45300.1 hypothetical protein RDV64_23315 [Acuticoccus sp. MNP-M23]